MAASKLTRSQAAALLPDFVVGLVYDHVIIDTPVEGAGRNQSVGLDLKTDKNSVVLHLDDYTFLQTEIVQFFLGRPFEITKQLAKAKIEREWPTPDPDQVPTQGDPSALPDSLPVDF